MTILSVEQKGIHANCYLQTYKPQTNTTVTLPTAYILTGFHIQEVQVCARQITFVKKHTKLKSSMFPVYYKSLRQIEAALK